MKNIPLLAVMFLLNVISFAQSDKNQASEIPFQIANGYFVKNTYTKDNFPKGKITTQKKFDAIFGAAAYMGANGKPTAINFETHYVIAIIEKETDLNTEINVLELKKIGRKIVCAFEVVSMEQMTSTMRPVVLLVVDKKDKGKIEFQRSTSSQGKESIGGLPLDSQWIIEFFNQPEKEIESKNCYITIDTKKSRFSGSDGCNNIGGNVTVSGGQIVFSNIIGTKKACENMEQSDLFTKNLKEVNRFKIEGGELFLFKDNTLVMTLESFR
jgi:heat shock protein HslJ